MDTGNIMENQLFDRKLSFEHQLKENYDLGLKNYTVWYRVDRRNETMLIGAENIMDLMSKIGWSDDANFKSSIFKIELIK
jgi:methylphosphotriester-DNA--protein-cysteine methyltransferase